MKKFNIANLLKKKGFITAILALAIVIAVLAVNRKTDSNEEQNLTDLNSGYDDNSNEFTKEDKNQGKDILDSDVNIAKLEKDILDEKKGNSSDKTGQETADGKDNVQTPDNNNQIAANNNESQNVADNKETNENAAGNDKTGTQTANNNNNSQIAANNNEGQSVADNKGTNGETANAGENNNEKGTAVSGISVESLTFNEESRIPWPVKGEILMAFSPEHGVYHSTLNQFKVNPALLISCAEGTEIFAGTAGIVTTVFETPSQGNMITIDVGDGYSFTYGQLKDISLKSGDIIEKGDKIGEVAKVTKYYTNEGEHLYFQIKYEDEPLNPETFMQ